MSEHSHATRSRRAAHPRLVELVLALGGFSIGTSEFVIMGLVNRVAHDLQVPVPNVGYAISSYALGVVVGAPLIPALAARVPRRALLIALMLLFAIGNLASALAPSFGSFVLLRFVSGLPHGAYFGVAALVAAAAVPVNQRAGAISRVMLGLSTAILIGAPLAERSTVPAATLKKFETTGKISLRQFLLLWQSVDDLARLHRLTKTEERSRRQPSTIDEVLGL